MITVFKNFSTTKEPHYVSVDYILNRIKKCTVKNQIEKIRAEKDEKKRRDLKAKLPCICFSGKFSKREDKAMQTHSGFVILDFDHLKNIEAKKKELMKKDYVYSIFKSPSGDGLKVLVRIPPEIRNHRQYYNGLLKIYPDLDSTSQNESRICYESIDSDIYINTKAIPFTQLVEEPELPKQKVKHTDYSKINIALKMIRFSQDGEKHAILLKASKLMGGYIASGEVDEIEAKRLLEQEITLKDIDDIKGALITIDKGIDYGKITPIHIIIKEIASKTEQNHGIIYLDKVWGEMLKSFIQGKKRGTTTYFKTLDSHWTWRKSETTLIIGLPNSGKTEFILQLMLLKSKNEGDKWGVFTPENYPAGEFYDNLIHTLVGKTTDPYYKNQQMTQSEYEESSKFVRDHFFYIYPKENHTINEIQLNFKYLIEKENISGTLIDPFNQLFNEMEGKRDDHYLSYFLNQRKRFANEYDIYDLITAHPKTMVRNKDGEYNCPNLYDISGGAMWGNKIDNLIVTHRPNYVYQPHTTDIEIHVKKVKKQKLVGIPGMIKLDFNRKTNRFIENNASPFAPDEILQQIVNYSQSQNETKPPF